MKRGWIFLALFLIAVFVSFSGVMAEDGEDIDEDTDVLDLSGFDAGYECLEDLIDEKNQESFSLQEAVFSILAVGGDSKLEEVLDDEKDSSEECWPRGDCSLRETAQVMLAYDRIGKDTDEIRDWLRSKEGNAEDLTWYLEIDIQNHVPSECTLRYDDTQRSIDIGEDMKISGGAGSCLSISSSGYWLRVREDCYDKAIEVSCDQDFITTLLYERNIGGTLYVSSQTHSAASLGTTQEAVNSSCFMDGSRCDYEGSLWASIALNKIGEDVGSQLPYLLALSDNNKEFFPSAFLYSITGADDQYSRVVQSQKQGQFWDLTGSPYNRFYDTSLAILALGGSGAGELDNSKEYLLEIQGNDGCWNNGNLRDTSFVLYSAAGRGVSGSSGGGGGGGTLIQGCEVSGFSCEITTECIQGGGQVLGDLACDSFGSVCCSIPIQGQSCSLRGGLICNAGQACNGENVPSAEGSCCLGACTEIQEVSNSCEALGRGVCRSSCFSDEIEVGESCSSAGEFCCQFSGDSGDDSGGSNLWLWILLILIVIIVLLIVFRNKIRVWWYKRKGKIKSSKKGPGGPPGPGGTGPRAPPRPPRFGGPMQRQRPVGMPRRPGAARPIRRAPRRDAEMEDTMKKLKAMSK